MAKKFEIRNSTAEFLTFIAEGKENGVEVMYADETIWCTQDAIATLFDKGRTTITEHPLSTLCRSHPRGVRDDTTCSSRQQGWLLLPNRCSHGLLLRCQGAGIAHTRLWFACPLEILYISIQI